MSLPSSRKRNKNMEDTSKALTGFRDILKMPITNLQWSATRVQQPTPPTWRETVDRKVWRGRRAAAVPCPACPAPSGMWQSGRDAPTVTSYHLPCQWICTVLPRNIWKLPCLLLPQAFSQLLKHWDQLQETQLIYVPGIIVLFHRLSPKYQCKNPCWTHHWYAYLEFINV